MENIISVREAAGILGTNRTQVFRLIKSNQLPAKKVGRNYVILKSDVDNYFEARWISDPVERVIQEHRETLIRLGDE